MKDQELCVLLEELRAEIEGTETVDAKEIELLRELDLDIRKLLERCHEENLQTEPQTFDRLDNAIDSLAVNHPTLTAMIANISTILSNAGI